MTAISVRRRKQRPRLLKRKSGKGGQATQGVERKAKVALLYFLNAFAFDEQQTR
jgi:hypothetical protein